jgi:GMP synthase-like glutamine amidotransferase
MHQDIIYEYPSNVIRLGSSPRCEVQGMYSKRRFITVQGHPEFDSEIVTEILHARADSGIIPADEVQEALARVSDHHDGVAVGAACLRFLLE